MKAIRTLITKHFTKNFILKTIVTLSIICILYAYFENVEGLESKVAAASENDSGIENKNKDVAASKEDNSENNKNATSKVETDSENLYYNVIKQQQ